MDRNFHKITFAALAICASLPVWAIWTHTAGGAKWSFTYTGANNRFAAIDGITDVTSSSLSVPSIVWHDNSETSSDTWPVVCLNLRSEMKVNGNGVTSIYIPSCVTNVVASSFQDCDNLRSVTWATDNGNTYRAGGYMFSSCSNLVDVTLPTTILSMGKGVFKDCVKLPTVVLPKMLAEINDSTFRNCTALSSFAIPENVVAIDDSAFRGCISLEHITIPQRTTTIGEYAFYGCSSLKYIVIPENVTSVGAYAFANCVGVKKALAPIALKGKLGKYKNKETAFSDMSVVQYYDSSVSQEITTSDGTPMAIEKSWMDEKAASFLVAHGGDYEEAANTDAANGMKVWECYVAGLDPMDPDSHFEAKIEMQNDLLVITWEPNLNEEEETRVYTIYGNETLDADGWMAPTNSLHRFFKVGVEMP